MGYYNFTDDNGQPYGSLECFFQSEADVRSDWCTRPGLYQAPSECPEPDMATDDPATLAGWYWVAGFPGCLWDGDPCGPFATEAEALADAGVYQP